MVGSAVPTMVWSSAASSMPSSTAPNTALTRALLNCAGAGSWATSAVAVIRPSSLAPRLVRTVHCGSPPVPVVRAGQSVQRSRGGDSRTSSPPTAAAISSTVQVSRYRTGRMIAGWRTACRCPSASRSTWPVTPAERSLSR
jgi:hypothetical protein